MDILLNTNLLVEYIDGLFKPNKSTNEKLLSRIIENNSNSFLLNKNIINEYENRLKDHLGDRIDSLYPFLQNLITNKSIKIKANNADKSNDIYEDIESSYFSDKNYFTSIVYSNISITREASLNNKYSCIINEISKPNIHWLISELAGGKNNSLTVRYFDFNSNDEIKGIFNDLFTLSDRYLLVLIYDRQTNFEHGLFDRIKKTHNIHYYTSYSRDNRIKNKEIKDNFRRVKIFKSSNKNIHERRLIVKDLIIETDNDFWNIRFDEPTWKIDISICNQVAKELIKKNKMFKRDLN